MSGSEPPRQNTALRLVVVAVVLGFLIIFAAALSRETGKTREDGACKRGDLAACIHLCAAGAEAACNVLDERCHAGSQAACKGAEGARGAARSAK